jgi:hydroxymethylpyrimidine/phosphomethylpyrimidine kinase
VGSRGPFIVATIAGSDPTGGAGLQGDLKTFASHGVYGTAVVTAITAQNHAGVQAMRAVEASLVALQWTSLCAQVVPDAAKTGMLCSPEVVDAVVDSLARRPVRHLVVDPVLVATSGGRLAESGLLPALRARLFPVATVITPNLAEAEAILGERIDPAGVERAAVRVLEASGARAVLVKGGHGAGETSVDVLARRGNGPAVTSIAAPRLATEHGHGAGCALSASLAVRLARGDDLERAFSGAKAYVHRALAAATALGAGRGPVRHDVPADGPSPAARPAAP